jgi:hypothetical protein
MAGERNLHKFSVARPGPGGGTDSVQAHEVLFTPSGGLVFMADTGHHWIPPDSEQPVSVAETLPVRAYASGHWARMQLESQDG